MRRNSGIIGEKISISKVDADGVHELFDNYNAEVSNIWPQVRKFVSV